jgi:hypothetical protein
MSLIIKRVLTVVAVVGLVVGASTFNSGVAHAANCMGGGPGSTISVRMADITTSICIKEGATVTLTGGVDQVSGYDTIKYSPTKGSPKDPQHGVSCDKSGVGAVELVKSGSPSKYKASDGKWHLWYNQIGLECRSAPKPAPSTTMAKGVINPTTPSRPKTFLPSSQSGGSNPVPTDSEWKMPLKGRY